MNDNTLHQQTSNSNHNENTQTKKYEIIIKAINKRGKRNNQFQAVCYVQMNKGKQSEGKKSFLVMGLEPTIQKEASSDTNHWATESLVKQSEGKV